MQEVYAFANGSDGNGYDSVGDSALPVVSSNNNSLSGDYYNSFENSFTVPENQQFASEGVSLLELAETTDGVKLYRPQRSTSLVWTYFGFPLKEFPAYAGELDKRRAQCIFCEAKITYSGSTSSLQKHLKSKHDIPPSESSSANATLEQIQAAAADDIGDALDEAQSQRLSYLAQFNGIEPESNGADEEPDFKPKDILSFLTQQVKPESPLSLATNSKVSQATRPDSKQQHNTATNHRLESSFSSNASKAMNGSPASMAQHLSNLLAAQQRQLPNVNGFGAGILQRPKGVNASGGSPATQSRSSVDSPNSSAAEASSVKSPSPLQTATGIPRVAPAHQLTAPVHVDIGGTLYTTTLQTLTKYPNSRLSQLFNGSIAIVLDELKQHYFIDRDGPIFRHILNFLRTGQLVLPDDFHEIDLLASESKFYQLNELSRDIEAFRLCRNNRTDSLLSFPALIPSSQAQPRSVINHRPINNSMNRNNPKNGRSPANLAIAKSIAGQNIRQSPTFATVMHSSNLSGQAVRSSSLAASIAAPPNANPCSAQLPAAKRPRPNPSLANVPRLVDAFARNLVSHIPAANNNYSPTNNVALASSSDPRHAYASFTTRPTGESKNAATGQSSFSMPKQHLQDEATDNESSLRFAQSADSPHNPHSSEAVGNGADEGEVVSVKICTQEDEASGEQQESAVLISGCQATIEDIFPEAQNKLFNMEIIQDAVVGLNLKDCSPQFDANVVFDRLHAHGFNADEKMDIRSEVIHDEATGLAYNSTEYLFSKA